jgi:hypothetical protein
LNPFTESILTVVIADCPADKANEAGLSEMLKVIGNV